MIVDELGNVIAQPKLVELILLLRFKLGLFTMSRPDNVCNNVVELLL